MERLLKINTIIKGDESFIKTVKTYTVSPGRFMSDGEIAYYNENFLHKVGGRVATFTTIADAIMDDAESLEHIYSYNGEYYRRIGNVVKEGVTSFEFPTLNKGIEIIDFTYSATRMGNAPTITAKFHHPMFLDDMWRLDSYVEFNGDVFYLKQTPTSSKSNEDARFEYDATFEHESVVLEHVYMYDSVVPYYNEQHVGESSEFAFFGDIEDFAKRLNVSLVGNGLSYYKTKNGVSNVYTKAQWDDIPINGTPSDVDIYNKYQGNYSSYLMGEVYESDGDSPIVLGYKVVLGIGADGSRVKSEEKLLSFENNTIHEALQKIHDEYGLTYYITKERDADGTKNGNTLIIVGDCEKDFGKENPFEYGSTEELLYIEKINGTEKIITRASGYGGSENIPYYYPNPTPDGWIEPFYTREEIEQEDKKVTHEKEKDGDGEYNPSYDKYLRNRLGNFFQYGKRKQLVDRYKYTDEYSMDSKSVHICYEFTLDKTKLMTFSMICTYDYISTSKVKIQKLADDGNTWEDYRTENSIEDLLNGATEYFPEGTYKVVWDMDFSRTPRKPINLNNLFYFYPEWKPYFDITKAYTATYGSQQAFFPCFFSNKRLVGVVQEYGTFHVRRLSGIGYKKWGVQDSDVCLDETDDNYYIWPEFNKTYYGVENHDITLEHALNSNEEIKEYKFENYSFRYYTCNAKNAGGTRLNKWHGLASDYPNGEKRYDPEKGMEVKNVIPMQGRYNIQEKYLKGIENCLIWGTQWSDSDSRFCNDNLPMPTWLMASGTYYGVSSKNSTTIGFDDFNAKYIDVDISGWDDDGWYLNGRGAKVTLADYGLTNEAELTETAIIRDRIEFRRVRYVTPMQTLQSSLFYDTDGESRFFVAHNYDPVRGNASDVNRSIEEEFVNRSNETTVQNGIINRLYSDDDTGWEHYEFENEYIACQPRDSINKFEDIKPTIKAMKNEMQCSDGNIRKMRIDVVEEFAYDEYDDDSIWETNKDDTASGTYKHPHFFAKLRPLGFNLFDMALQEDMVLSMTTGDCGACNFKIKVNDDTKKNPVQVWEYDVYQRLGSGNYQLKYKKGDLRRYCDLADLYYINESSYERIYADYEPSDWEMNHVKVYREKFYSSEDIISQQIGTLNTENMAHIEGDVVTSGRYQGIQQDTTDNYVWVALEKETETYGVLMPSSIPYYNQYYQDVHIRPKSYKDVLEENGGIPDDADDAADHFVLTNILMPFSYIRYAERELSRAIVRYIYENNYQKYNFSIRFSRIYMAQHKDVMNTLNENSVLYVKYFKPNLYKQYVSTYTYTAVGSEALPEIKVEMNNELSVVRNYNERVKYENKNIIDIADNTAVGLVRANYRKSYSKFLSKNITSVLRGNVVSIGGRTSFSDMSE